MRELTATELRAAERQLRKNQKVDTKRQPTFRQILNLKRKIHERKQWQKYSHSQRTVETLQREIDKYQKKVDAYEAIHGEVR